MSIYSLLDGKIRAIPYSRPAKPDNSDQERRIQRGIRGIRSPGCQGSSTERDPLRAACTGIPPSTVNTVVVFPSEPPPSMTGCLQVGSPEADPGSCRPDRLRKKSGEKTKENFLRHKCRNNCILRYQGFSRLITSGGRDIKRPEELVRRPDPTITKGKRPAKVRSLHQAIG
jgi:hypothetical protein